LFFKKNYFENGLKKLLRKRLPPCKPLKTIDLKIYDNAWVEHIKKYEKKKDNNVS